MRIIRPVATRPFWASAVLLSLSARLAGAQALTGTMVVRVTADGTPLPGVAVATRTASSVTDRSGRATFKLPTGQYFFRAMPSGFRPESLSVFVGVGTTTRDLAVHHQVVLPSVTVIPTKVDAILPTAIVAATAVSAVTRTPVTATHVEVGISAPLLTNSSSSRRARSPTHSDGSTAFACRRSRRDRPAWGFAFVGCRRAILKSS